MGDERRRQVHEVRSWTLLCCHADCSWVDPSLELDIYADKPWALSPALAGMSNLSLSKTKGEAHAWVEEDTKEYVGDAVGEDEKSQIGARRKWFGSKEHRQELQLKDVEVGMEFANGLLGAFSLNSHAGTTLTTDFNTLSATLPQPFHLSVPLLKYWEGSPVTYVCRRRSSSPVSPQGVYWSVGFEIIDEQAIADLEKRGGKVLPLNAMSDDVD